MHTTTDKKHSMLSIACAALTFAASFAFWLFVHPEALSFHEQYTMFLCTWDFAAHRLAVAGGLAEYVGEFITQFAYYPAVGAALMALLMVGLGSGVWAVMRKMGASEGHCWLSVLPVALLIGYMGDENVEPAFAVALTGGVWMAAGYGLLQGRWARIFGAGIGTCVCYWALGPVAWAFAVLCGVIDMRRGAGVWAGFVGLVCLGIIFFIASISWMSQYTTLDILLGHNYHNFRMTWPAMQFVVEASIVVVPVVGSFLPPIEKIWVSTIEGVTIFILSSIFAITSYDADKYAAIAYDSLVRAEKWDEIIERATKRAPKDATSMTAVNLALAERGELCKRMFAYPQKGAEGLIAPSRRDQFSAITSAEALFRLGMVNEAQHYFFDSQEGIVDCHKSARLSKRIAETLIVNGRYEMARKYLHRLSKTLFYSRWVKKAEWAIKSEATVCAHPTWGRLRTLRYKDGFVWNYYAMDKMLAILYTSNTGNRMALDYYMAQCLLRRDIQRVWKGLGWAIADYGRDNIPRHIQEAVALAWIQGHKDFEGVPITLSESVVSDLMEYMRIYTANASDPRLDTQRWRATYWHYLLRQKPSDATTGATQKSTVNEEQTR